MFEMISRYFFFRNSIFAGPEAKNDKGKTTNYSNGCCPCKNVSHNSYTGHCSVCTACDGTRRDEIYFYIISLIIVILATLLKLYFVRHHK